MGNKEAAEEALWYKMVATARHGQLELAEDQARAHVRATHVGYTPLDMAAALQKFLQSLCEEQSNPADAGGEPSGRLEKSADGRTGLGNRGD